MSPAIHMVTRAVIVEPREHPALGPVLDNICSKTGIPITVVHGTANREYAEAVKSPCVDTLMQVNAENLSIEAYSKLLMTDTFWRSLGPDKEKILLFQTDTGICGDWDLQEFGDYDYCGAPWPKGVPWQARTGPVGNGGFSIRRIGCMRSLLAQHGEAHFESEDIAFSSWMKKGTEGCAKCPADVASRFACEMLPGGGCEPNEGRALGFHKNFAYDMPSLCSFNSTVRDLYTLGAPESGKAPDVRRWTPELVARTVSS